MRELASDVQRFGQRLRETHARQQPDDRARPADDARQHVGRAIGIDVSARLQQRDAADRQRGQDVGDLVEFVDAERFEVVAERRFDGTLPTTLHD